MFVGNAVDVQKEMGIEIGMVVGISYPVAGRRLLVVGVPALVLEVK